MKYKKLIYVLFIFSFFLCSCGSNETSMIKEEKKEEVKETVEKEEEIAQTPEPTEASNTNKKESNSFNTNSTLSEQIVYDKDGIIIKAVGLDFSKSRVTLSLEIENNSAMDISLVSGSIGYSCNAINEQMVTEGFSNTDVLAGKKAMAKADFSYDELSLRGIKGIHSIDYSIEMEEKDNYKNVIFKGPLHIDVETDCEEDADFTIEQSMQYIETIVSGGRILHDEKADIYNEEGIHILEQAIIENKDGNKTLLLKVKNESEEIRKIILGDFSTEIIALTYGDWTSDLLLPHKTALVMIHLNNMIDELDGELIGEKWMHELHYSVSVEDGEDNILKETEEVRFVLSEGSGEIDESGTLLYEDDYVKIISKGFFKTSKYSDDMEWKLLALNKSEEDIILDEEYGTISLNDYMVDGSLYNTYIPPRMGAIVNVKFYEHVLAESQISTIEEIEKAEVIVEIRNAEYHELSNATVAWEKTK